MATGSPEYRKLQRLCKKGAGRRPNDAFTALQPDILITPLEAASIRTALWQTKRISDWKPVKK